MDPNYLNQTMANAGFAVPNSSKNKNRLQGMFKAGNRQYGNSLQGMAKNAQKTALDRYGELSQTGLTAADRLAQQQANKQAAMYEQSQRQGIMQNAQMRGIGGSGLEMASALSAQQGGADRSQMNQTAIAQNAQQRAMDATAALAGVGSQVRGDNLAYSQYQTQKEQYEAALEAQKKQNRWNNIMGVVNGIVGGATSVATGGVSQGGRWAS